MSADNGGCQNEPEACAWFLNVQPLPFNVSGLNMIYSSDELSRFSSDLAALDTHTVITSLDIESVDDLYAISEIQSVQTGGFSFSVQTVAPANFQAVATQLGAQAQVITAVSFDVGQITYVAYSWTQDPSTVYEVQTASATFDQIPTVAMNLASQGYIITAFGAGDGATNGFLFVGTRVKGDTLPRPIFAPVTTQSNTDGFAIVGVYSQLTNSGNVSNSIAEQ
jgi:hypothetical protein